MKVVFLAPEFLPVWGGVGTYSVELIRHFPEEVEVHVITPLRKKIGKALVSSASHEIEQTFNNNVHIHFVSTASDTFWYNGKFQVEVGRILKRFVKTEKPDLIHSNAAHMPDLLINPHTIGAPLVTTIHTTLTGQLASIKDIRLKDLEFSEKMTKVLTPTLSVLEDSYYLRRHHFITVSHIGKKIISREKKIPSKYIKVIYNGIDPFKFSPSNIKMIKELPQEISEVDTVKVLYLSRLIGKKGIHILLQAIPNVLKRVDAHFIFAGPGIKPNFEYYKIPKDSYSYLGYVSENEKRALYAFADIFVLPSFYENFPISILEAMSSETPPVSTLVGGIPEIIASGHNGMLIPKKNVSSLVNALITLIENDKLRKKMGRNARKTILERFTWKKTANLTLEYYKEILEGVK